MSTIIICSSTSLISGLDVLIRGEGKKYAHAHRVSRFSCGNYVKSNYAQGGKEARREEELVMWSVNWPRCIVR